MRILLAEDEKELNRIVCERLREEQYSVDACLNGEEALAFLQVMEYDVVILDIMMPIVDGLEVLQTLRANGKQVPVLMLTAKDSIQDRVKGLDAGADDYLVKPFAFDELLARIRVLLRKPSNQHTGFYQVDDLVLYPNTHKVLRADKEIHLSAQEFSLLRYMMQNTGIVLSREKLEQHIWNYDYSGESNVIDVYIRYLRKKIDEGHAHKLLHTIRGVGYVLKVDV